MAGKDFPRDFVELESEILTRALDEGNKPIYYCTFWFSFFLSELASYINIWKYSIWGKVTKKIMKYQNVQ